MTSTSAVGARKSCQLKTGRSSPNRTCRNKTLKLPWTGIHPQVFRVARTHEGDFQGPGSNLPGVQRLPLRMPAPNLCTEGHMVAIGAGFLQRGSLEGTSCMVQFDSCHSNLVEPARTCYCHALDAPRTISQVRGERSDTLGPQNWPEDALGIIFLWLSVGGLPQIWQPSNRQVAAFSVTVAGFWGFEWMEQSDRSWRSRRYPFEFEA